MRRLIVHAEDYNFTPGVNRGILLAHREGIVTSTSVLANLPGLEHAIPDLIETLDVGVHLNLTFGRPVLSAAEVPSLVDNTGRFRRLSEWPEQGVDIDHLRAEMRAQIEKVRSLGVRPTHVDTHHHAQRQLSVFLALSDVVAEEGLCARAYDRGMHESLKGRGIKSPDYLVASFFGAAGPNEERFLEVLSELEEGTGEICVHPAFADEALRALSSYAEPREQELAILRSPRVKEALEAFGIELVTYFSLT